MAQTSQEPGPTDTSTAEKCRSRQTGSASYKVSMLKYHCCWMQHCKWVCMLKFEQISSQVSTGILKAWDGHGPPAPTLGTTRVAPVVSKAWCATQHHEHALLTPLHITHTEFWLAILYILKVQTENALVFPHLQSAISLAFSSKHGWSDPRSCFPAHNSWSWNVLLSALPAQLFMPYRQTQQGTRYRFKRHRNNVVCSQRNKTLLGSFSFFQEEWKHNTQYFSKFERF